MIDYIREQLSQEELLCQLSEEASELSKAALKLRRVYDGANPTPVKRSEAYDNLLEEFADVMLAFEVLGFDPITVDQVCQKIRAEKLKRWYDRLKEAREENQKPLTIKDLIKMQDQAVWVQPKGDPLNGSWGVVEGASESEGKTYLYLWDAPGYCLIGDEYEAYRHKPKEVQE